MPTSEPRRTYTWYELLESPREVFDEIERGGVTAAITRHGSFKYLIRPVTDAEVIGTALSVGPLAEELARRLEDATE